MTPVVRRHPYRTVLLAPGILLAAVALGTPASAHELRPLYLDLREQSPGVFSVLWKVPRAGDAVLSVRPLLPGPAPDPATISVRHVDGATVMAWTARTGELRGQTVALDGLDATMTDALVRIELEGGRTVTRRLQPRRPAFVVPAKESALGVASAYLGLGIEHIFTGVDHLMFVGALLLLAGWQWSLVRTVTAFTAAHSLTLALAALGFVHVPPAPVEALIALSIALVAAEVVRCQLKAGREPVSPPWTMAFAFGLLHGLGFASALAGVGLPEEHVPLALLLFNCGVEAGQLAFLATLFATTVALRRLRSLQAPAGVLAGAYALGIVAMYWAIERAVAI